MRHSLPTLSLAALLLVAGCGLQPRGLSVSDRLGSLSYQNVEAPPEGAEPDVATVTPPPAAAQPAPTELLVSVAADAPRKLLAATDGDAALAPVREFTLDTRMQVVKVPAGMSRETAIAKLKALPGVLAVGVNRTYRIESLPNDPLVGEQWALKANRTNAEAVWTKGVTAASVTVAVLDTGVDYRHPDLAGRVVKGYDFADKDADPMDPHGHGTHVAGIISAVRNNGVAVAGVTSAKILAIKVLSDNGQGSTDAVMQGIKYAADNGAKVINMSLGTPSTEVDSFLHQAIQYANGRGVTVVAAAGNQGGPVGSPANDPLAIAVASTSNFWVFEWCSTFSNRGPQVALSAPGGGIVSLFPSAGGTLGKTSGKLSGTSMAAPYVSAGAALVLAQHPSYTPAQVRAKLLAATDDLGTPGRDDKYGAGRLNYAKLLN